MDDGKLGKVAYEAWNISGVPWESPFIQGNVFREGKWTKIAQDVRDAVIDALVAEAEAMNPQEDFTILDSDAWQVVAWLKGHKSGE